jgi:hypothetical protein
MTFVRRAFVRVPSANAFLRVMGSHRHTSSITVSPAPPTNEGRNREASSAAVEKGRLTLFASSRAPPLDPFEKNSTKKTWEAIEERLYPL